MTRYTPTLLAALALVLVALVATPAAQAAEPKPAWLFDANAHPTNFTAGHPGDTPFNDNLYVVRALNIGAAGAGGSPITLSADLPDGVTPTQMEFYWSHFPLGGQDTNMADFGLCSTATASCTLPPLAPVQPNSWLRMKVHVATEADLTGPLSMTATVSGGGAKEKTATEVHGVDDEPAQWGIHRLRMAFTDEAGEPDTRAGGHPYQLSTLIAFPTTRRRAAAHVESEPKAVEDAKDVVVDLPLGFLGNAQAAPTCTHAQFLATPPSSGAYVSGCPDDTIVGFTRTFPTNTDGRAQSALYNLVPQDGYAAQFGYIDSINGSHVLSARVARTERGYVLRTVARNIPQVSPTEVEATFYGNPAERNGSGQTPVGFFTNPTDCSEGALVTRAYVDSWQNPGRKHADGSPDLSDPNWKRATAETPEVKGCNQLRFESDLSVEPHTTVANSPSGVDVTISIPQNSDPDGLATPPLKKAVVTLPEGLTVNPGSADGLGACSPAQIDLERTTRPSCPENSKIGALELDTPLLAETLHGSVFLASQNDNPFGTLLAAYLVIDDPKTGVVVKIPGKLDADPQTGRITGTFDNNPQFPFSQLRLHFKGGPRGVLATPGQCGTFMTTSMFTPWSAPDSGPGVSPTSPFSITSGCVAGFQPSFTAGSKSARAGGFSPFVLSFSRSDRDEALSGLTAAMPEGLLAKLAGVPLCSDADADAGSCPAASQVGSVTTGAGVGDHPLFLPGRAYLTGPYNGGPYGLAVVVPAEAGPYDLGDVVVRTALRIDRSDAQVTAVSDPFPTILEGIPLRLRRVDVSIDRPGFMINPTGCEQKQIAGTLTSTAGSESTSQTRFQVGDCAALAFNPRLGLRLTGRRQVRSGRHPGVRAVVRQGGIGEAGIDRARVALPKALALDPDNARALCEFEDGTKPDLENHCPEGSVVGRARAKTPLLDKPLVGNVYFVKNVRRDPRTGNEIRTLPMLVVALRGEIAINLRGNSSTTRGGLLVNTFAGVPDAPISRFNLNLRGGKSGILVVTETRRGKINLCRGRHVARTVWQGQNGKRASYEVAVKTPCTRKQRRRARG